MTMWRRLCAQFGLDPDEPDYATNTDRLEHVDALTRQLEQRVANLDRDALLAQLADAGVLAGRIRTIDEVYEWEQGRSQRLTLNVEHPTLGTIVLPGTAIRTFEMSATGDLAEARDSNMTHHHCSTPTVPPFGAGCDEREPQRRSIGATKTAPG